MEGMGSYYRGETLTEFAPNVPYRDLDLGGPRLADQFSERIMGLYLRPAKVTVEAGYAFAAGLLTVSCIDALSQLVRQEPTTKQRFVLWTTTELPSFGEEQLATRFYEEFRNGLVHEARVKNGGRFSLSTRPECVLLANNVLSVNAKHLVAEVEAALVRYIDLLKSEPRELQKLSFILRQKLSEDLLLAREERRAS